MRSLLLLALWFAAGCTQDDTPLTDLAAPVDFGVPNDAAAPYGTDAAVPDAAMPTAFKRIVAGSGLAFTPRPPHVTGDGFFLSDSSQVVRAFTASGVLIASLGVVSILRVYGHGATDITDSSTGRDWFWWPTGTFPHDPHSASAMSDDGLYIAAYGTSGDGGVAFVVGPRDRLMTSAAPGTITKLVFSPVTDHLYAFVSPGINGGVDLYRVARDALPESAVRVATNVGSDVAFSADGELMAVALLPTGGGDGTLTIASTAFDVQDAINTSGTRQPVADVWGGGCPLFIPQHSLVVYAGDVAGTAMTRRFDYQTAESGTLDGPPPQSPLVACAGPATAAWLQWSKGICTIDGSVCVDQTPAPHIPGLLDQFLPSGVLATYWSSMTGTLYQIFGANLASLYACGPGHYGTMILIDDSRSLMRTGPYEPAGPQLETCNASGVTPLIPAPVRDFAYDRATHTLYFILDDGVYAGPF